MKIAFLINDFATEDHRYTTTRIAKAAAEMDHEVFYLAVADFAYDPDEHLSGRAHRGVAGAETLEEFFEAARSEDSVKRIAVDELDVLMLRNDPADDSVERPWAQTVGTTFGSLAAGRGVVVLNHPMGLSKALDKLYLQSFPAEVRASSLITRDESEIRSFIDRWGTAVVKPLVGSGGHNVFLAKSDDENISQMIESVLRDGYVIAQEYLDEAENGDLRVFLIDGEPLKSSGTHAAFRRTKASQDLRSNMHVGGEAVAGEVDDDTERIIKLVGPRLQEDGMFFTGLDVVGDKLLEINVFSPGGFGGLEETTGIDFTPLVLDAIEERYAAEHAQ